MAGYGQMPEISRFTRLHNARPVERIKHLE
jgi:hypothetical protein